RGARALPRLLRGAPLVRRSADPRRPLPRRDPRHARAAGGVRGVRPVRPAKPAQRADVRVRGGGGRGGVAGGALRRAGRPRAVTSFRIPSGDTPVPAGGAGARAFLPLSVVGPSSYLC